MKPQQNAHRQQIDISCFGIIADNLSGSPESSTLHQCENGVSSILFRYATLTAMTSAQQTNQIRIRLLARRAALEAHSAATSADRKPVELDQSSVGRLSRMDAMQVQAMSAAAQRSRENELTRISAALARLDDGEFGYCVSCGEAIAKGRLEIDLTTATCIKCAAGRDR